MSRILVTVTQAVPADSHVTLRRLAADSAAHAAEDRRMLNPRELRQGARVKVPAADRNDAGRLDVVAGCEFVDDRIRLEE